MTSLRVTDEARLIGALVVLLSGAVAVHAQGVGVSESSMRRMADHKPMPVYPPASVQQRHSGVVVAFVVATPAGPVERVDILEAPDPDIAAAVKTALMQWTFTPVTIAGRPESYGGQGKLTFYFRIVSGAGRVLNPEQVPGNEHVFDPPSSVPAQPAGARPPAPPAVSTAVSSTAPEIGDAELQKIVSTTKPVWLDVRGRDEFAGGHRDGVINIPAGELDVRARAEFSPSQTVVIDCAKGEPRWCHAGASILMQRGITHVYVFIP
jgi:rhodanese-related sulfurtransferase